MTNIFRWSLIFSLALFFGACSKVKAPTDNILGEEVPAGKVPGEEEEEENLRPWEKLPEIDHSWPKLRFYAYVENDKGKRNPVDYAYPATEVSELVFKPTSGKFKTIHIDTTDKKPSYVYDFSNMTENIDREGGFKVYYFINGELTRSTNYISFNNSPLWYHVLSRELKVGDVKGMIMVFKGKDGVTYKYTVPPIKFADAN